MSTNHELTRRRFLHYASGALFGASASGWLPALANELAASPSRRRHCILLWMPGGPSQTDTFDMKPGHANGGEFKETATKASGLRISEHLPKLAAQADQLCVLRGLSTREGDHSRGTYLMRTGHVPGGPVRYPTIGASLSKSMATDDLLLPSYVSVMPQQFFNPGAFGPGFLGPKYAATTVSARGGLQPNNPQDNNNNNDVMTELGVDNLRRPAHIDPVQFRTRVDLWNAVQKNFLKGRDVSATVGQDTVFRRALDMMNSGALEAFDLSQEPKKVREQYGRGFFGQGCLLARRLVERGVPFVEVSLGNGAAWDTHQNNFESVRQLSGELDAGWGALMGELRERGLLESTTILWTGEFGRTPQINMNAGRDHFPAAWTSVLAGGGVKGGQAFGKTSDDGTEVLDGKLNGADLLTTLCRALGVSPDEENISEEGRPIRIAEGTAVEDVLA